jgi:hypothetical protein
MSTLKIVLLATAITFVGTYLLHRATSPEAEGGTSIYYKLEPPRHDKHRIQDAETRDT